MTWAEKLAPPFADQEAHASNVQCVKERQGEIKGELDRINEHVVACIEVLEYVSPDASASELVRCSAECGSLNALIQHKRDGLREITKKFDEKVFRTTEKVNMHMLETAPFCTSLLERVLNVQAKLEDLVLQWHEGGRNLRRLLTEAYEASAGLSENESPSVRGAPMAPNAPLMPSLPISPLRCVSSPFILPPRLHARPRGMRPRLQKAQMSLDALVVEVPPPAIERLSQIVVPLCVRGHWVAQPLVTSID